MSSVLRLTGWRRGVRLESRSDPSLYAYLWFYEWHMFDAVLPGEHTGGTSDWGWHIANTGESAQMDGDWLKLGVKATENGADLRLDIRNDSGHDWPAIAAIIPCLNPGHPEKLDEQNPIFLDREHVHTYFQGAKGLDLIAGAFPREIHLNHTCRPSVMSWTRERADGRFVWDEKWPTSARDAYDGILMRESDNGRYVMGIAWDAYLSAQGHNPWYCMHLSIKVGPLAQGETRTIRGKIYLMEGSRTDCLNAYEQDSGAKDGSPSRQRSETAPCL